MPFKSKIKLRASANLFLGILAFYIFCQFLWWANLLIRYNPSKKWMVAGEGAVFLVLLVWGIFKIYKAINREIALAKAQKNFLLSITHELKTPLAATRLFLQTLVKRDLEPDKQKEILTKALNENERLADLIENVLLATSLDSKQQNLHLKTQNISELLKLMIDKISESIGRNHIWKIEFVEELYARIDTLAFHSICQNLLENAIKYSPVNSEIKIRLFTEGSKIVVGVYDQGIGIDKSEEKKIFEKFYRIGNEETRATKGTGLGLYIAKHLSTIMHAELQYSPNEPKGSAFKLYLAKEIYEH